MKEMNVNQIVDLLLTKENEIQSKFSEAILIILRTENSEIRKNKVIDLKESVQYTLEEIERIINR